MTAKAVKIADIKGPDKVAPAASGRPLVVTNRPVIADPMVVAAKQSTDSEEPKAPTRTSKVIKPMTLTNADLEAEKKEEDSAEDVPKEDDQPADSGRTSVPLEQTAAPEPTPAKVETPISAEPDQTASPESPQRDVEAEAERAKEQETEAEIARQQELDTLIASGKYAVPIGAVRRRKSRMFVLGMCLIGLLLVVLLVDVLFDIGIVSVPHSIPHTHFFSS